MNYQSDDPLRCIQVQRVITTLHGNEHRLIIKLNKPTHIYKNLRNKPDDFLYVK